MAVLPTPGSPIRTGLFFVLRESMRMTSRFRDRIEAAFQSRDYSGSNDRQRMGKNDSIFERLDVEFGFEGAFQHSVSVKGANVSRNSVRQMLKNWKKQSLIVQTEAGRYRKVCH